MDEMDKGEHEMLCKQLGTGLQRAFAQPMGQTLPQDCLAMLAELDRSKR